MSETQSFPIHEYRTLRRIEFADTDMGGMVHFSRFFVFMETAEHEFLRTLGAEVHMTLEDEQILIAIRIQIRKPGVSIESNIEPGLRLAVQEYWAFRSSQVVKITDLPAFTVTNYQIMIAIIIQVRKVGDRVRTNAEIGEKVINPHKFTIYGISNIVIELESCISSSDKILVSVSIQVDTHTHLTIQFLDRVK